MMRVCRARVRRYLEYQALAQGTARKVLAEVPVLRTCGRLGSERLQFDAAGRSLLIVFEGSQQPVGVPDWSRTELRRPRVKTSLILVAFSLLCLAFPVDSQQPLVGLIQGTVKNQQGAPVPNASVTATNLDTIEREWQASGTNSGGTFQIVDVPPGHYSIAVTNKDYQDYLLPFVTLHDGQTVNINIKMKRKDAEKLGAVNPE